MWGMTGGGGEVTASGGEPERRAPVDVRRWVATCAAWGGRVAWAGAMVLTTAIAADDNRIIFPGGGSQPTPLPPTVGGAANTITLFVAALFAAVGGWLYWRNRKAPGLGRDSRLLTIEETRGLGNRQYLVVASYDGKKFLLGVCPGRIDMLAPLNESRSSESQRP